MIKRLKKNVFDVMKTVPENRTKADVQDLIRKYLQENIPEFKKFDDKFFSSIHYGCTALSGFKKGECIHVDHNNYFIVYQGQAQRDPNDFSSVVSCHTLLSEVKIYNTGC